jgi:hypothetical protein
VDKFTKSYLAIVLAAGAATMGCALAHWRSDDPVRLAVFLALLAAAAMVKGKVPGVDGKFSAVFFFALLGSTMLSFAELAIASALAGIVQCTFKQERRPAFIQICFNVANLLLSAASGFVVIQRLAPGLGEKPQFLCFLLGAAVYYLVNTGLVSGVLTLVHGGSIIGIWSQWFLSSLPYYLVGALIVGAVVSANSAASLAMIIVISPPLLLATLYYRVWLGSAETVPAN